MQICNLVVLSQFPREVSPPIPKGPFRPKANRLTACPGGDPDPGRAVVLMARRKAKKRSPRKGGLTLKTYSRRNTALGALLGAIIEVRGLDWIYPGMVIASRITPLKGPLMTIPPASWASSQIAAHFRAGRVQGG